MKTLRLSALFIVTFFAASFSQHALAYDGHSNVNVMTTGYVLNAHEPTLIETKVTAEKTFLMAHQEQERTMNLLLNGSAYFKVVNAGYVLENKMRTISFKTGCKDRPA